jgi:hypothetical protein
MMQVTDGQVLAWIAVNSAAIFVLTVVKLYDIVHHRRVEADERAARDADARSRRKVEDTMQLLEKLAYLTDHQRKRSQEEFGDKMLAKAAEGTKAAMKEAAAELPVIVLPAGDSPPGDNSAGLRTLELKEPVIVRPADGSH